MSVAASAGITLQPTLEEARELAREGNVVPVRATFIDDCETPVSAFLKLRAAEPEGAPCILLESAEQGQVGRYSFVGLRPRAMLRWSDGQLFELSGRAATLGRAPPVPPPPPLPGRPGRLLRLRPVPQGRPARRADPRRARPPRHGADGDRR